MRTVWKDSLRIDAMSVQFTQVIRMPVGSKLVHMAEQHGHISLWFEVDDDRPIVARNFQIFGTGNGPIRDYLAYCGTAILHEGRLVLHVYEVTYEKGEKHDRTN